jgi:hypothetical protein
MVCRGVSRKPVGACPTKNIYKYIVTKCLEDKLSLQSRGIPYYALKFKPVHNTHAPGTKRKTGDKKTKRKIKGK